MGECPTLLHIDAVEVMRKQFLLRSSIPRKKKINKKNDSDNVQQATNALVFLAICLNGHWKVPLHYFVVHSLTGSEKANLLTKYFELIAETGAKCF